MITLITACTIAFGCFTVIYISRRYLGNAKPTFPLPPGPPGLPWVGNVTGVNEDAIWLTYHEWAKTYGDIVYSRRYGREIIIINSEEIAKDLLDHCSSNTSGRPYSALNTIYGTDFITAFQPYGDCWKLHRRFLHQTFRNDAVSRFLPFQHYSACQFLRQLFREPEQFGECVSRYVTSVMLNSAYGYYDFSSASHEFIRIAIRTVETTRSAVRPDIVHIIDAFPTLLKLPAWLPGMSFKRDVPSASKFIGRYVNMAYEYSLHKVHRAAASMVHDAFRNIEGKGTPDESWTKVLREAATSVLGGGEPSNSVLMTFFLVMALNLEAQEKAQTQIDAVVGKNRLPAMGDRPLLPLVDAILRETLRYGPVVPLSIPHAAVDEFMYRGFRIPKGAILVANVWAMTHNESRFPDSQAFVPERFLSEDGSLKPNDMEHIAYGFGQRICPGRHFSDAALWSVIAKVLAAFKILTPLDENGVEAHIEPKFWCMPTTRPLPFKCRIVPRVPGMDAEKLEQLIAASTL